MQENQEKFEEQLREQFSVDKLFANPSATVVNSLDDLEEKEDFSKPKTVTRYVVETTETVEESTSEVSNENVESNGEKSNYPQKVEKKGGFFEKIRNFFFKSKHKNT